MKANTYTPPVDLGLMREVLTQKQTNYDNNVDQLIGKFKECLKIVNLVDDANRPLIMRRYNALAQMANRSDLSDRNTYRFISGKINDVEEVAEFSIKHPDTIIPNDIFE